MSTIHDLFSLVVDLKDEIKHLRREVLDLKKLAIKSDTPMSDYSEITQIKLESTKNNRKRENSGLKSTLTSSETAKLLGISTSTVYRWRKARKIEGEMIGGTWFFHKRVLLRFIKKNGVKPIKIKPVFSGIHTF